MMATCVPSQLILSEGTPWPLSTLPTLTLPLAFLALATRLPVVNSLLLCHLPHHSKNPQTQQPKESKAAALA